MLDLLRLWDQFLGHHDIFRHQRLLLFSLFLLQIVQEDFSQVCLASLLKHILEEVLVLDHELLKLQLIKPLMLELALVHFAHTRTVEIFAREKTEIVRKTAVGPSMAIVCQCKFTKKIFLRVLR
jgi:hypothetical protein